MPFIPAPNCVEVVLRFLWSGQTVAITLSFCRDDAVTPANASTLLQTIRDWYTNHYKVGLSNTVSLVNISATDLTSQNAPVYELPVSPPEAGNSASASLPNNAALVTSFQTAQRGRSFRGRVYNPGLVQANITSPTTMSTAYAAGLVTAFSTLAASVGALGWDHVVISRQSGGVPRVTAVATPITAYATELNIDSQRRRLAGRGS